MVAKFEEPVKTQKFVCMYVCHVCMYVCTANKLCCHL